MFIASVVGSGLWFVSVNCLVIAQWFLWLGTSSASLCSKQIQTRCTMYVGLCSSSLPPSSPWQPIDTCTPSSTTYVSWLNHGGYSVLVCRLADMYMKAIRLKLWCAVDMRGSRLLGGGEGERSRVGKRNVHVQTNVVESTKFNNVILDMNLKLLT